MTTNPTQMTTNPTTTIENAEQAAATYHGSKEGRLAVIAQAKAEASAGKAAVLAGAERPASPALDFLNTHPDQAAKPAGAVRSAEPKTVRFHVGDRGLPDRTNTLARVAKQVKMPAAALRALLTAEGIASPASTSWTVTLPSGVVISARPLADAAKAKGRATTKAEPATPGKVEATPAKRQVTPRPKASPAKAPARKRTAKATAA